MVIYLQKALLGVSCGPLTGANIVLPFVSCLFHDVNKMTGLFIHLMPPMVIYTFMWHTEDIRRSWPDIFQLTYMNEIHFSPTMGSLVCFFLRVPHFIILTFLSYPAAISSFTPNNRTWLAWLGTQSCYIWFAAFPTLFSCSSLVG